MFSSVLKVFYVKLYVHPLVDKLKRFYENARCYNKIYIPTKSLEGFGDQSDDGIGQQINLE